MTRVMWGIVLGLTVSWASFADPELHGATLPNARTVALDETATAFFTVLNNGNSDATNCQIATSTFYGSDLGEYMITSQLVQNGVATGPVNPNFSIPADGRSDFVVGISRDTNFQYNTAAYVFFRVDCDGGFSSLAWPNVNGVYAQFRDNAPDVLTILGTPTQDGIATFNGNRVALIAGAAVNIGAGDPPPADGVEAPADNEASMYISLESTLSSDAGQFAYEACMSDPLTGECTEARTQCVTNVEPCMVRPVGDEALTFNFYVAVRREEGTTQAPESYRLNAEIRSPTSYNEAESSVAVADIPPVDFNDGPYSQYYLTVRNTDDAAGQTIREGDVTLGPDGGYGQIFRTIDRGAFIEIRRQYFKVTWEDQADPNYNNWQLALTFLDTRAPSELDRPNDWYQVSSDRSSCSFSPGAGGTCNFTAGDTEQMAGEPSLFDAGGPFQIRMFQNQTMGPGRLSNPSLTEALREMQQWDISEGSASGFESVTVAARDETDSTEIRSPEFQLNVDGCLLNVVFEDRGQFEAEDALSNNHRYGVTVQIDESCPENHPIRAIAASAGITDGIFLLETIGERPFGEGVIDLRFTLNGDLSDPDAPKTTIRTRIDTFT